MNDVIKRIDELISEAEKEPSWTATQALRCLRKELLKEQPDIVRCKDCKWYYPLSSLCDNCGLPQEEMFFCADGKRKVET